MKKLLFFALLMPAFAWAQKPGNSSAATQGNTVSLVCRIYGVPPNQDSVFAYENIGLANRIVARSSRRGVDSAYVLTLPASSPKIYLIGSNEMSTAKVILGQEKEVTLWGNSQFMQKARTVNSAANKDYEKTMARIASFQDQSNQVRSQYNLSQNEGRIAAEGQVKALGKSKSKFLDSLKTANPLLYRVASLQLRPDYAGQGNEPDFYATQFFSNADLSDKTFEGIPDVFSAFEAYMAQLMGIGVPHEKAVALADAQLAKIPAGSRTYRMALGGIISGLKAANSAQFPVVAKKYAEMYRSSSYGEVPRLEMEVRRAGSQLTGFEAPELEGMTPDSSTYSLKQLRGKIVMIDFWASWCGPCRKENPNVVENYNKYKDKGFDILGVSLDRDIAAWRKAIAADGLPWHHISDLKGWQSSHAALYSVTSIPQTLLLDREGKIIARNLRGEQLGAKLKEIFGM
jgi:thiol-disulfide isomerase/thioredoxin